MRGRLGSNGHSYRQTVNKDGSDLGVVPSLWDNPFDFAHPRNESNVQFFPVAAFDCGSSPISGRPRKATIRRTLTRPRSAFERSSERLFSLAVHSPP